MPRTTWSPAEQRRFEGIKQEAEKLIAEIREALPAGRADRRVERLRSRRDRKARGNPRQVTAGDQQEGHRRGPRTDGVADPHATGCSRAWSRVRTAEGSRCAFSRDDAVRRPRRRLGRGAGRRRRRRRSPSNERELAAKTRKQDEAAPPESTPPRPRAISARRSLLDDGGRLRRGDDEAGRRVRAADARLSEPAGDAPRDRSAPLRPAGIPGAERATRRTSRRRSR